MAAKNFPLTFSVAHLLHRLYGVDAPGQKKFRLRSSSVNPSSAVQKSNYTASHKTGQLMFHTDVYNLLFISLANVPIVEILSLTDLQGNLQRKTVKDVHLACNVFLHYLVKLQKKKCYPF